jgi:hypothetical protein
MFFKQNPMDHLTDDPIIRCDIADRVLKAAESGGNLPIAWRVYRSPQVAETCQTRASPGPMQEKHALGPDLRVRSRAAGAAWGAWGKNA